MTYYEHEGERIPRRICYGVSEQVQKERSFSLHVEDSPQLATGSFNYQPVPNCMTLLVCG